MLMPRQKKPVSYALDPKLLRRLRSWIERQEIPPKQTAVLEAAIREFLDKREGRK